MARQIGKYEIGRRLGEGQFGKVKEAVDLETGARYAVKIIQKSAIKCNKDVETVKKEIQFMRMLDHPNILRMIDTLEDQEKMYLVLEIAAGGDLFDKIVNMGGFTEEVARTFFKQVMDGLEHCHAKGIIHRDLKPENLLLGPQDVLKISDFGLSNIILTPQQMLKTHCGSEKYAAPEIMQSTDPYAGKPVDVWSCGVILYIMVGGAFPFVEATAACDLYQSLVNKNFEFPKHFSPELIDLLLRMFTIDPAERITVPEIQSHKWLNPHAEIIEDSPLPNPMEVDYGSMDFDECEQPRYRSLEADIVDAAYFEEEPVYRSLAPEPQEVEKSCAWGSCRPTEEFAMKQDVAQALDDVANLLKQKGAEVKVKAEKGQIKAEMAGQTGDVVKVQVLVQEGQAGKGSVLCVRRMKGHALDYHQMFSNIRPEMLSMCD